MQKQQAIILTLSAILLVLASAGAASYLTKANLQSEAPVAAKTVATVPAKKTRTVQTRSSDIAWDKQPQPVRQQQVQQAPPPCNDNNIVGTLAGGVGGGLVGSQFGKGNGKTAAAVLGAVGGAALGNNMIPTQNVTCR